MFQLQLSLCSLKAADPKAMGHQFTATGAHQLLRCEMHRQRANQKPAILNAMAQLYQASMQQLNSDMHSGLLSSTFIPSEKQVQILPEKNCEDPSKQKKKVC